MRSFALASGTTICHLARMMSNSWVIKWNTRGEDEAHLAGNETPFLSGGRPPKPGLLGKTARVFLSAFCLAAAWANSARAQEKVPWARIVVIGASVSRGFTVSKDGPKMGDYALDRYLNAALLAPHEPAQNLASAGFFLSPDAMGNTQIRRALTNGPTLVVGIDFLFWFCYGKGNSDQDRLDHFEQGLKLLEGVDCPLIIGDIPDASAATNSMLSPDELPSPKVRLAANRRLKEWAAPRPQVTVVPVAEFMRAAGANDALIVHGHALARGTTSALLQDDRLHPSRRGCAVLAIAILDTFLAGHPGPDPAQVRWDPDQVLQAEGQP